MTRMMIVAARVMLTLAISTAAFAADARTSAQAGQRPGQRNGDASATAQYEGDIGFARTNAVSGPTSASRGVAVGVDRNGLALSVSTAYAPAGGPSIGTSFNINIGAAGGSAHSRGDATADGPIERNVAVGGQVGQSRGVPQATASASARSDRLGMAQAQTHSQSSPKAPAVRYAEPRRRW